MIGTTIFLAIVLLVIAGGAVYGILRVRRSVRNISRMAFGTDSFMEGLEQQEVLMQETPKSVAGMTSMCLPRIEKDFPEFHWLEWRQRCETVLKSYLQAIDQRDIACLEGDSAELKKQVQLEIDGQRQLDEEARYTMQGESRWQSGSAKARELRSYERVKIHRTEISRYQKEPGMRVILIQSAVEHRSRFTEKKIQTRFNMELVYIQDITKIKDKVTAASAVCPNCGAPVTRLGDKYCEYCGGAVETVNERVWKLHRIEEEGD